MNPKPLLDLFIRWPLFWINFWAKRFGMKAVLGGMGLGTLLAVYLNYKY